MSQSELDILKKHYASYKHPIIYCDSDLNLVWNNKSARPLLPFITSLLDTLTDQQKSDFIQGSSLEPTGSHILTFHDHSYLFEVIPYEKDGFFVSFYDHKTANNLIHKYGQTNPNAWSMLSYQTRYTLSNIFNVLPFLKRDLEQHELYDSIPFLEQISKNAFSILRMTNSYLEYQKLMENPAPLKKSTVNVTQEIDNLLVSVKATLIHTKIKFSYEIPDHPIFAEVDMEKLNLALLHLISNAGKYTSSCNQIHVKLSSQNNELLFQITDSGAGISPEEFSRIFQPYYSLDPNTDSYGGLGLGLSYAKRLAELHGGSCLLTSVKNQGTKVMLRIPMGKPDTEKKEFCSTASQFSSGKFSPVAIYLSDICEISID